MNRQRALALVAVLLLGAMYLSRIGGFVLQDPDEGRYAEIPREMIETGDWVTPKLFYVDYFEKPPLLYWLTAISFETFGLNEWAARLVPALSGLVTVFLTWLIGVRLAGARAAWLACGMLATMPLFFALSQALLIDVLLAACTTAALFGVYAAHTAENKRGFAILVAVATALGVLAKGLIAIVLPGGIALAFLLWRRDFVTIRALLHWQPLLAFVVVAVPWFVLVSQRNPDFLEFFFVREHFQRFTATGPIRVGHPEGPFYYIPVLMFGPAPWTLLVPLLAASAAGRRAFAAIPPDARLFSLLWLGIMMGFFSAATSKLGSYVVPALPALALLLGAWLDRALEEEDLGRSAVRIMRGTFAALGLLLALAALLTWPLHDRVTAWLHVDEADVFVIAGAVSSVALALLASVLVSRWLRLEERGRPAAAYGVLIASLALVLMFAIEGRAVTKTGHSLAEAIAPLREPGDLLISYKRLMQSLGFYTRQRIVQFDAYHEVEAGALTAPDREEWFWQDFGRLEREWSSGRRVFMATDRKHLPELEGKLDPKPRLLVQDHRRVVLVNFPATAPDSVEAADTAPERETPDGD